MEEKGKGENLRPQDKTTKPSWDIYDLLKGQSEAIIYHAGKEYRLRVTKNNKLILTK